MANNIATGQQQAGNEASGAVKVAVVSRQDAMVSTYGRGLINRRFKVFHTSSTGLLANAMSFSIDLRMINWA